MIEIKDYGYNYQVIFNGDKKDYIDFYLTMNSIPDCFKLKGQLGYKMPKCYLPVLKETYDSVSLTANPWDNIGEGLKLQPFCYQKETIQFGVDNEKGLLILPCGSGKN